MLTKTPKQRWWIQLGRWILDPNSTIWNRIRIQPFSKPDPDLKLKWCVQVCCRYTYEKKSEIWFYRPSFCVGVNGTPGALGDETLRYWFNVTFTILVSVQGPEVLLQHASERDLLSSGQAGPGNRLFLSGFLCSCPSGHLSVFFFCTSVSVS